MMERQERDGVGGEGERVGGQGRGQGETGRWVGWGREGVSPIGSRNQYRRH